MVSGSSCHRLRYWIAYRHRSGWGNCWCQSSSRLRSAVPWHLLQQECSGQMLQDQHWSGPSWYYVQLLVGQQVRMWAFGMR
jgi:hypothetical protein